MKLDREICIVLRVLSSFRHIGDRLDCEVYLRQHRFSSFNLSVEDRMSSISVISGHSKYISVSINRKPSFLTEDIPRKFSKIQHEHARAWKHENNSDKENDSPAQLSQLRSCSEFRTPNKNFKNNYLRDLNIRFQPICRWCFKSFEILDLAWRTWVCRLNLKIPEKA